MSCTIINHTVLPPEKTGQPEYDTELSTALPIHISHNYTDYMTIPADKLSCMHSFLLNTVAYIGPNSQLAEVTRGIFIQISGACHVQ